jgi:hypothetical protein
MCLAKYHAMKVYCGNGGIAPRILNLGTAWRWVVSFTTRPPYLHGKNPGTHWIGGWVEFKLLPDVEFPSIVTILTELPHLPFKLVNILKF